MSLAPLTDIFSAQRKGLESLAIALERRNHQRSPILNYGWMPDGLAKPRRAKARNLEPDIGDESIAPLGDLFDPTIQQVQSDHWGGHQWSDWTSVSKLRSEKVQGLYRLRNARNTDLVIIGHGAVAHAASFDTTLTCSFVPGPWSRGQRRELLDDLIALHPLSHARLPGAQFGGNTSDEPEQRESFVQYLRRMEESVMEKMWFPQVGILRAS